MDIEEDSDLLWIAREGLKCKLPNDWKACKTTNGDIFYYNFESQESQWEHPRDEEWKTLQAKEQDNKGKRMAAKSSLQPHHKPPVSNSEHKMAKSKVNPLNKVNMENYHTASNNSMENMDLDPSQSQSQSHSPSKSNSLKRLDMVDNDDRDSNEGIEIENENDRSSDPSDGNSKTASKSDLQEPKMSRDGSSADYIQDYKRKVEEEVIQYNNELRIQKKKKIDEMQKIFNAKVEEETRLYEDQLKSTYKHIDQQNKSKVNDQKKKKETDFNLKIEEVDFEAKKKLFELEKRKESAESK